MVLKFYSENLLLFCFHHQKVNARLRVGIYLPSGHHEHVDESIQTPRERTKCVHKGDSI